MKGGCRQSGVSRQAGGNVSRLPFGQAVSKCSGRAASMSVEAGEPAFLVF